MTPAENPAAGWHDPTTKRRILVRFGPGRSVNKQLLLAVHVSRLLPSALLLLAALRLSAAPVSVAGVYENEGLVIATESAYRGPVSLRALLGLEFDHALGVLQHAAVSQVKIDQRDDSLLVRLLDDRGTVDWHGRWRDNGGFEADAECVKFLLRAPQSHEDVFLFTLTPVHSGAGLLVRVQFVHATTFGPGGTPVGEFLFLRVADPPRGRPAREARPRSLHTKPAAHSTAARGTAAPAAAA